jgi:hypothetical protein
MWLFDFEHPKFEGDAARAQRAAQRYLGRMHECPYSKEAVVASAAHGPLNIDELWMAEIQRPPTGSVVLGEWKDVSMPDGGELRGRFTHLLRPYSEREN